MGLHLLLADDGSLSASVARQLVASLVWPPETCVEVVAAMDDAAALFEQDTGGSSALASVSGLTLEGAVRERLTASADRLATSGVTVRTTLLRGHPGAAIVAAATRSRPDLVVVGGRSPGTYGHLGLGPISSFVAERAPTNVLVARRGNAASILMGHDGSEVAAAAVDLLATWPMFAHQPMHLVSVVELPDALRHLPFADELMSVLPGTADALRAQRERHQAWLADGRTTLEAAGRSVTTETRIGVAARELLAAADVADADLIVVGDRNAAGMASTIGRVCVDVLVHANASVLLVRTGTGHTAHTVPSSRAGRHVPLEVTAPTVGPS